MDNSLFFGEEDFLNLFNLPVISFDEFCQRISVLDIMDRSGSFVTRSHLNEFIERVSKKDNRKQRLDIYKQNLYKILVTDAHQSLKYWFSRYGKLSEPLSFYFNIPDKKILNDGIFSGRTDSKYGKICKNINFLDFYSTKKLWNTDSEYTLGLLKVMFEEQKIRNSLVGPAFFDHICNYKGDSSQFWLDFMIGCNRASIFNPATYKAILDELFTGDTLFAPVMGWNSYQLAFYSSRFTNFISTDVIPDVVHNGKLIHQHYEKYRADSLFSIAEKTATLFLCPSEELNTQHNFAQTYRGKIDAVLFSPPYFDLEIYPSDNQSIKNYPDYGTWLEKYWGATIELCAEVLKPGGRLGFVISNYVDKHRNMVNISQDMSLIVQHHLELIDKYRVQWSVISGSRQAKKTREGNFEDLWLFQKTH